MISSIQRALFASAKWHYIHVLRVQRNQWARLFNVPYALYLHNSDVSECLVFLSRDSSLIIWIMTDPWHLSSMPVVSSSIIVLDPSGSSVSIQCAGYLKLVSLGT